MKLVRGSDDRVGSTFVQGVFWSCGGFAMSFRWMMAVNWDEKGARAGASWSRGTGYWDDWDDCVPPGGVGAAGERHCGAPLQRKAAWAR